MALERVAYIIHRQTCIDTNTSLAKWLVSCSKIAKIVGVVDISGLLAGVDGSLVGSTKLKTKFVLENDLNECNGKTITY